MSHYMRSVVTDSQGKFQLDNLPFNNYHLSASAAGFHAYARDVEVRSPVPLVLKINLSIGTAAESVTVTAGALEEPLRQIAENSGVEGAVVVAKVRDGQHGSSRVVHPRFETWRTSPDLRGF